jgi:hypothetical protein
VRPLLAPARPAFVAPAKRGVLSFTPYRGRPGWYSAKTLWFSTPDYRGPVFIRGRRLDRYGRIVMGEGPSLIDPQLPPDNNPNGTRGWRQWPGATWLRFPGCYAWQVDGDDFSTVIVFKAVLVR